MSTLVSVRRGVPGDLDVVAAQFQALWPSSSIAHHTEEARAILAGRPPSVMPVVVFVAEIGGRVVGFVEASLRSTVDGCDPARHVGYIEGWFVGADHRRKGVGKALMGAAEDWARSLGCTEMGSDALADNAVSERAHLALGYEVVDRCVNFRKTISSRGSAAGKPSRLRLVLSVSLDGFVAGPEQSVKDPLGKGGMRVHEWVFVLARWREMHGLAGGEVNLSSGVVEESRANIGATIMGRNMFGGHPGPWDAANPWNGWWGEDPPFHHPVFVLTHHARAPLVLEGGNTFTFVTGGIESALEEARRAAGGKDVAIAGGASAARQYLNAGLVDEMWLNLAPALLGAGERLFDGTGDDLHGLELVRTVAAPNVTHLHYTRR